jgi:hypothetical protein
MNVGLDAIDVVDVKNNRTGLPAYDKNKLLIGFCEESRDSNNTTTIGMYICAHTIKNMMCICLFIDIHICVCAYIDMNIYIDTCIYIHTYIYAYK